MPKYIRRNGEPYWDVNKRSFERKNDLPYGMWTCASGRQVLYNRFYEPIFERPNPGSTDVSACDDPREWVEDIVKAQWFYQDATRTKRANAARALQMFRAGEADFFLVVVHEAQKALGRDPRETRQSEKGTAALP